MAATPDADVEAGFSDLPRRGLGRSCDGGVAVDLRPAGDVVTHTAEYHEQIKLDDEEWGALEVCGVQHIDAYGDEPEINLELRTCACRSTLARPIKE